MLQSANTSTSLLKSIAWYLLFSSIVFVGAWFWLTWQVRYLLEQRVSETGHQLAQVAAIASAEAVVSEDKVYLSHLLEQLTAKNFVLEAAIYRLDGTLIAQQIPIDHQSNTAINFEDDRLKYLLTAHLPQYVSPAVPFMVEVKWQGNPVGWLQVTLDRLQLEQDFRNSSYRITLFSIVAFSISLLLGIIAVWRRSLRKLKPEPVAHKDPKESVDEPLHSLTDAAQRLKKKTGNRDQLHFKPVSLRRYIPLSTPTLTHSGLVQLFSIKSISSNATAPEQILNQQLIWQNILFEAAALFELKASLIGRNQFLITGDKAQTENAVKLGFLIHEVQTELSHLPELACHCSMLLGLSTLSIKQINERLSLVAGGEFQSWLEKLRKLNSYAMIDENMAENLDLVEHESDIEAPFFTVENHPEKTIQLPPESQSIIERQAQSLIKKYWEDDLPEE